MSFYATILGTIRYETRKAFNSAVGLLDDGSWLRDGFILNEIDRKISDQADVDAKALTIRIPFHLHRNLTSRLDKLFIGGKGKVVWTSTDGCFRLA